MKKKLTTLIAVSVTILMLVFVVIASFFFTQQSGYASGFTVTSISSTQVISENTNLNNVFFLINAVANGGGQSIVGTITPEQTEQLSGYKTDFPLKLTISTVDEVVDANIENLGDPIYKYTYLIRNRESIWTAPVCPSNTEYDIPIYSNWLVIKKLERRVCINKLQVGTLGRIQQQNVKWNADLTLSAGGESHTESISNGNEYGDSVQFYDGGQLRATVQWTGSLVTGDGLPEVADLKPVFWAEGVSEWRIVHDNTKDQYDGILASTRADLNNYVNNRGYECDSLESCTNIFVNTLNELNHYVDRQMKTENVQIQSGSIANKDSLNSGKVRYELDRRITNPSLAIKVVADWVGVLIESSEPAISRVACPTFKSGEIGVIETRVENVGGGTGTFAIVISGCDPIKQRYSTSTDRFTLSADEAITYDVQLSTGNANEELVKQCQIRVYDVNDPSSDDTTSVSCKMERARACDPGDPFMDGKCIKQCKDGTRIETIKCCDYGVKSLPDGTLDCKQDPSCPSGETRCPDGVCRTSCGPGGTEICFNDLDDDNDGKVDELDCYCPAWISTPDIIGGDTILPNLFCLFKKWLLPKIYLIAGILGFISFLIVYVGSEGYIQKYKIKTKKWTIPKPVLLLTFAALAGLLVGLVTLWFWWLGLLALVFYIIIMIVISKLNLKTMVGL